MEKKLIVSEDSAITVEGPFRKTTGAMALLELGTVALTIMTYWDGEEGTQDWANVCFTPEHAREFALNILREVELVERTIILK